MIYLLEHVIGWKWTLLLFNAVAVCIFLLSPIYSLCVPARNDWERFELMLVYHPAEVFSEALMLICLLVDAGVVVALGSRSLRRKFRE